MTYSSEVLADAPLFYWRLNEASGAVVADSSGNARDATLVGTYARGAASLLASDPTDSATDFSNGRAEIAYATWMHPAAFSAEAWFKPDRVTGNNQIIGHTNYGSVNASNYSFHVRWTGTRIHVGIGTTSGGYTEVQSTTTTLAIGSIYHVVMTWNGATVNVYLNGALEMSFAKGGTLWEGSTVPLGVGLNAGSSVAPADGVIDEASFYGSALSAARVTTRYSEGTTTAVAYTGSLTLGGTANASSAGEAAATGSLSLNGAAAGAGGASSGGSLTLGGSGVAVGVGGSAGAVASGSIALSGNGVGSSSSAAAASGGVSLSGNMGGPSLAFDFSGTGTVQFSAAPVESIDFGFDASGKGTMGFSLSRPEAGTDATTGVTGYKVVGVDMYGQPQVEIHEAMLGSIKWSVSDKGSFSFTVRADDPKVIDFSAPEQEIQLWRGSRLLDWYVITKARANEERVEFTCKTTEWYFDRRVVGPVPRTGVFLGTHLEYRTGVWRGDHIPGTQPANPPVKALSTDQSIIGGKSLVLSPSGGRDTRTRSADVWFTTANGSNLTAEGEVALTGITNDTFGDAPTITVNVYHDSSGDDDANRKITEDRWDTIRDFIRTVKPDAKVTGRGRGSKHPVESNATAAGREANRRIDISFRDNADEKGHGQYVSQSYEIRVPTSREHRLKATFRAWVYVEEFDAPAMNNWGLVLERQDPTKPHKNHRLADKGMKRVYSRKVVPITRQTPRNRWVRMEASLMVPNDGDKYVLEGRMFPPSGLVYFDEADLFFHDSLDFQDEEQGRILRKLVEHAQDEEIGKTDLNIGRSIPTTGIKRTRRYFFADRTYVGDHLNEFSQLGDGMEWDVQVTPTQRTLTAYYPRKERETGYVLSLGSNIASADVEVDGEQTSNVVVVMANEVEAYAREERAAVDMTLIDGTTFETAYMATPGSAISSLNGQAKRGLERYRKPIIVPSVRSNPAFVDELLDNVQTGDVVLVDVRKGWFQTQTEYRILDIELDPRTEQFTYTLMPEDTPLQILQTFGDTWRYFTRAQTNSTSGSNNNPKETHPEWAEPGYDDSGWATGTAGFGWYNDGSSVTQQQTIEPATTIPQNHEVWMRKTVKCTEEMYVAVRCDKWAWVYVNGTLISDTYRVGSNFNSRFIGKGLRVPTEVLNPSGDQVVTVHVQDRLADPASGPRSLYADCKVKGIYNPDHVGG